MRSEVRREMNCLTFSFATSRRLFGLKSSASIELERSIASTMLIPSLVWVSVCAPERGRANATIKEARARFLSRKIALGIQLPDRGPDARTEVREKTIASFRRSRLHIHQAGSSSNSHNASGV